MLYERAVRFFKLFKVPSYAPSISTTPATAPVSFDTEKPPEEIRGRQNELRALNIVNDLIREEIVTIPEVGTPYITEPMSELDKRGFDIMIPIGDSAIGIQIKSSLYDLENFVEKNVRWKKFWGDPEIPCVRVNDLSSDERLRIELLAAIMRAYEVQNP